MDDEELDFEEEDFGDIDSLLYENESKDNSKVSEDTNNDQNNDKIIDKTESTDSDWSDSVDSDKGDVEDQQEDKEMVDPQQQQEEEEELQMPDEEQESEKEEQIIEEHKESEEQTDVFDQLESLLKAYEKPDLKTTNQSQKPLNESLPKPSPKLLPKPLPESLARPSPKPLSKQLPESLARPSPKPLSKQLPESEARPSPKPLSKQLPESEARPSPKPLSKQLPESLARPSPKPLSKQLPESEARPSPKPLSKQLPKSAPKPLPKPLQESAPKPLPESVLKPSAKLLPESVPKPSNKSLPESVPKSLTKSLTASAPKPLSESAPKPSPKPLSESAPKPSPKPLPESLSKTSNEVLISNSLNMFSNCLTSSNVSALTPTQLLRKKTVDLDKKFYDSIRIYLKSGKIIGYAEDTFKTDAKPFKLKDNKLFMNSREVIETEKRQMDISVEFHVNPTAKSKKSRHRGVSATVRAIENRYFWGTIKYDVENVITQCRVCNPLDYDLMSHQLWKYIEIGVIESILIVRDLNEKSSIFNCSFFKEISAIELSKHLLDLFKIYGTPNAIRIVLNNNLKNDFLIDFREYLRNGFMDFTEEFEFISQNSTQTDKIKLPMIDIKIEDDVTKFPKSEKELDTIYAAIGSNDNISLFFIFPSNKWLLNDSIYNSISTDIKNFAQKFSDWESRVSTLTLYFQINGINLLANEVEEQPLKEETAHRERSLRTELKRLETDFKPKPPSYWKRETKKTDMVSHKLSESSEDWSDDDMSVTSSKHSVASNTKRRKSLESKENSSQRKSPKEFPLRDLLREKKKRESDESLEIQCIDIDDSSQQSLLSSQLGSDVISISSETRTPEPKHIPVVPKLMVSQSSDDTKTIDLTEYSQKYDPNGICQPCVVILNHFSQEYIEKAINGYIDLESGNEDNPEVSVNSPEIMVGSDNGIEGVEEIEETRPQVMIPPSRGKDMNNMRNNSEDVDNYLVSVKSIVDKELEKRSKKEKLKKSVEFKLSESSDNSSEEEMSSKSKQQTNNKQNDKPIRNESQPKPNQRPTRTQTPSLNKTSLTPKTKTLTPKPKRKRNSSDDSDYDIRKDLNFSNNSTKRVKNNIKNISLSNSKSIEKKRPKNRLVLSSSDSESCDENKKKVNNNLNQKKEKTVTNTVKTSEVIKCQFCDFSTNERGNYILHSAKHRNEQKNKICCHVCTQVFYNKDALERHKEEEHPPQFLNAILYGCEKCKNAFQCDSLQELDQHLMTHIEELSYLKISKHRCSLCQSFVTENNEIMANHMTQKHRMYKCAFDCPFVAPDFQSLERHAKSVHSRYGQPYECKYCDYNSAVFGALVQHKEKTHVIEWTTEHMNKCGLCESVFNYDDTDNILEHMSSHTIEFTYFYCKSCNKKMRKVGEIKKHCTIQHGVGPADGIETHISNLNELFNDLRKQLTDKNNKSTKINSTSKETQNAIQGLMDEQFEAPEETDIVGAAFDIAMNGDAEDYQQYGDDLNAPTIIIPETQQTDEWTEIEEDADGIWNPVDDSNQ